MNRAQNFYRRVAERRATIAKDILTMPHQPKSGGAVFVVSLDNRERGTTAGTIATVSVDLAACLLESGTHSLASESEVLNFKAGEAKAKQQAKSADLIQKENHNV